MTASIRTVIGVFAVFFVASCSDGEIDLGPENTDILTGGGGILSPVIIDGVNDEVFSFGVVNSLRSLPNAQESIITASFVGLDQAIERPDGVEEAEFFVETCSVGEQPIDSLQTLAGRVEVTVGGNVDEGDELVVRREDGQEFVVMEKSFSEDRVGYVGRIPLTSDIPDNLSIDVPGNDSSLARNVVIPSVDEIDGLSPGPGARITQDTAFTWQMMEPIAGQSPPVIEISVIKDGLVISCQVQDDGAFLFSDAEGLFELEDVDGSVLSTVSRSTSIENIFDDSHVTAINMTFRGLERVGSDLEDEIAAGEFGEFLDSLTELQIQRCQLPQADRIDNVLTDDYCSQLMCERPLEERGDPLLTEARCEELGPIIRAPSPVLGLAQFQCMDENFFFSPTTLSAMSRGDTDRGFEIRQALRPTSVGSTRGFGQEFVQAARSYTLTQDILFENGFDLGGRLIGGKVGFGLYGGTSPTGGQVSPDGWSARLMWRANNDGTGRFVVYSYAFDRRAVGGSFGEDYVLAPHTIPIGSYVNVTMTVEVNTPGNSDGSVQVWINGQPMLDRQGIMWQRNGVPSVDKVAYSVFHGGNSFDWAPSRTNHLRFSNVCWGSSDAVRS